MVTQSAVRRKGGNWEASYRGIGGRCDVIYRQILRKISTNRHDISTASRLLDVVRGRTFMREKFSQRTAASMNVISMNKLPRFFIKLLGLLKHCNRTSHD